MLRRLVALLIGCAQPQLQPEPVRSWRDERPALLRDAPVHRAPEFSRGEAP